MVPFPTRRTRARPCASLLVVLTMSTATSCLQPATVRMGADPELDVPVLLGRVTRLGGDTDVPGGSATAVVLSQQFPGSGQARLTSTESQGRVETAGCDVVLLRSALVHGNSFVLFQGAANIGIRLHGAAWPRLEVRR